MLANIWDRFFAGADTPRSVSSSASKRKSPGSEIKSVGKAKKRNIASAVEAEMGLEEDDDNQGNDDDDEVDDDYAEDYAADDAEAPNTTKKAMVYPEENMDIFLGQDKIEGPKPVKGKKKTFLLKWEQFMIPGPNLVQRVIGINDKIHRGIPEFTGDIPGPANIPAGCNTPLHFFQLYNTDDIMTGWVDVMNLIITLITLKQQRQNCGIFIPL